MNVIQMTVLLHAKSSNRLNNSSIRDSMRVLFGLEYVRRLQQLFNASHSTFRAGIRVSSLPQMFFINALEV